jgi:hypothetical protein
VTRVIFAWAAMTFAQRTAAQAFQRKAGVGVDGLPANGDPSSVFWELTEARVGIKGGVSVSWGWRNAIFPTDLDVRLTAAKPATKRKGTR